ncbi:terminase small subunit [Inquilinus sp. CAU 1745]|uniref:terminase small subunit n=1 Tax=Inquilinus sp. CAU 1745 TaxID=3140369 RepID=UPI00325B0952
MEESYEPEDVAAKLTPRQEAFCQAVAHGASAASAARAAGYAPGSVRNQACRLLNLDDVRTRIEELREGMRETRNREVAELTSIVRETLDAAREKGKLDLVLKAAGLLARLNGLFAHHLPEIAHAALQPADGLLDAHESAERRARRRAARQERDCQEPDNPHGSLNAWDFMTRELEEIHGPNYQLRDEDEGGNGGEAAEAPVAEPEDITPDERETLAFYKELHRQHGLRCDPPTTFPDGRPWDGIGPHPQEDEDIFYRFTPGHRRQVLDDSSEAARDRALLTQAGLPHLIGPPK